MDLEKEEHQSGMVKLFSSLASANIFQFLTEIQRDMCGRKRNVALLHKFTEGKTMGKVDSEKRNLRSLDEVYWEQTEKRWMVRLSPSIGMIHADVSG